MNNSVSQELLKFLQKSPTAFHAVAQMKDELLKARFTELKENERWKIERGGHYFVTRNRVFCWKSRGSIAGILCGA